MNGITIKELEAYTDGRGWNTHPLDEELLAAGKYRNVHLVSMNPGAVRGNHLHRSQVETIFVIGGPCLMAAADPKTGDAWEQVFDEGKLFRITVSPGLPHAFKNIGPGAVYLLCAADLSYDPKNPDCEPFELLK